MWLSYNETVYDTEKFMMKFGKKALKNIANFFHSLWIKSGFMKKKELKAKIGDLNSTTTPTSPYSHHLLGILISFRPFSFQWPQKM